MRYYRDLTAFLWVSILSIVLFIIAMATVTVITFMFAVLAKFKSLFS